ncbi:MAG: septum formation initiator family protein [Flavisolibacter sp.]|nr:septum formation initiator family protein [Flavisolibacter sp.]
MKLLSRISFFLRNKYLLAGSAFIVWMLFFDRNDMMMQLERRNDLKELQESKEYYTNEIKKERQFLEDLKNNPAAIEKFAREQYRMKRDNEDIYLIQPLKDK